MDEVQSIKRKKIRNQDAYHDILTNNHNFTLRHDYEEPSKFKQELVERFLKQAPNTYRVGKPPRIIDCTAEPKESAPKTDD